MFKQSAIITFGLIFAFPVFAKSGGVFLKNGFGAKGAGLGGAYSATVKDASALFWNPAGLAHINGEKRITRKIDPAKDAQTAFEDPEFDDLEIDDTVRKDSGKKEEDIIEEPQVTITKTFEFQFYATGALLSLDRQLGFVGVAMTALGGTIGAGMFGSRVEGINGYDSNAVFTGKKEYRAFAGYLGYAFETAGDTRIGVSLMGLQEDIGGNILYGGGINVGVQKVVFPVPYVEVGLDIKNLAGAIQSDTIVSTGSDLEKLDTILGASVSITSPPPSASAKLLLGFTVNLDDPENEGFQGNIGFAFTLTRYSYIMAGFRGGQFAGGIGLAFKHMQVAYAINRDPLGIGFQHFADLNVKF